MLTFQLQKALYRFTLDISYRFKAGITALVGPSGAGKTTLLNLLTGITKPDKGIVTLFDRVLFNSREKIWVKPQHRELGYVFQQSRLFPHYTVHQNLTFPLQFVNASHRRFKFDSIVDATQIKPLMNRYPSQLSGGELQRVALARALLAEPKWLLLDEPMGALDIGTKFQFLHFLKKLSRRWNLPMVIVSHDINTILSFADEIVFIRNGKLREAGKPFQVVNTLTAELETLEATHPEWDMMQPNYHNIIEMTVQTFDTRRECLVVQAKQCRMYLPHRNFASGTSLVLHIPSNEIILATRRPQEISANTILEGKIVKIEFVRYRVFVTVDCGVELVAEVVPGTVRRLKLEIGKAVYLILKATSIRIIYVQANDSIEKIN